MSARMGATWVGVATVLFGLGALAYPERLMGVLALTPASETSRSAVLAEIRAVYGGLFLMAGLWNLYAIWKGSEARLLLVFLGSLWLGLAGGRALGFALEGNPGLPGWAFLGLDLLCAGVLLFAAWQREPVDSWRSATLPQTARPPVSAGEGGTAP